MKLPFCIYVTVFLITDANMKFILINSEVRSWFVTEESNLRPEAEERGRRPRRVRYAKLVRASLSLR